jgi:biopolymer transport protein ExbD
MKFLKKDQTEEIKLNMTAMIDIVFQLLVFFIMTFKVTAMEADFNIRMPAASDAPPEEIFEVPPTVIYVNLRAGQEREIAGIDVDDGVNQKSFNDKDMYLRLTDFVESTITTDGDPSDAEEVEVEFTIAEVLKYRYTVQAIEAVSGKVEGDTIKTLVEKIKFRNTLNN